MSDEKERELAKISSNECPRCGEPIKGGICKKCGLTDLKENFYDPDYTEYEAQIEKSNEEFFKNLTWEEVKE